MPVAGVNFKKMVDKIDQAHKQIQEAMAEFSPLEKLEPAETYLMGHIRAADAVLQSAKDFVVQTEAYRNATKKPVKPKKKSLAWDIRPGSDLIRMRGAHAE